jgi:hypothetical protein
MIKKDPELRHVLSHVYLAIESLAGGHPADCRYELESIRNLVFFSSDEEQIALAKEIEDEKER